MEIPFSSFSRRVIVFRNFLAESLNTLLHDFSVTHWIPGAEHMDINDAGPGPNKRYIQATGGEYTNHSIPHSTDFR